MYEKNLDDDNEMNFYEFYSLFLSSFRSVYGIPLSFNCYM